MGRPLAHYVALAFVGKLSDDFGYVSARTDFSGDFGQLMTKAEQPCGFGVHEVIIRQAVRSLADCGLVRVTEDNYSGTFYKIKSSLFDNFISKAGEERVRALADHGDESVVSSRPSDYPAASALLRHELFDDYHELGNEWLIRALAGLRERASEGRLSENSGIAEGEAVSMPIPAADRIVSIDHNSFASKAIDDAFDAIEAEISGNNSAFEQENAARQVAIVEISALRKIWSAPHVRLESFKTRAQHVLIWVIEKGATAAITDACKHLFKLILGWS